MMSGSDDGLTITSAIPQHGVNPFPGGPFSGLTPSMWPQDILFRLQVRTHLIFIIFSIF